MAHELKKLPGTLRNPFTTLDMVEELREHAEMIEKAAAESGRTQRERGRVLKIRNFALELEELANTKIGGHEQKLKS